MFRFKSAERLRALFTSAYPKRLFRPNALLRSSSPALMYSSRSGSVLPSELSRSVVRLTCESTTKGGICNVYLIGTFPYNQIEDDFRERNRSCYNVKVAIKSLKPQVVFLGLCPSLAHDLKPDQMPMRIVRRLFDQEVIAEFRVAYEEAQKLGGKVILGNRHGNITWHRSSSPSLILASFLFLCPNWLSNMTEYTLNLDPDCLPDRLIFKSFRDNLSCMKEFYVDECAQYMSATLLKVAREHTTVVAVVSNLHLPKIQKYWKQHIEVEDLLGGTWPVAPLVTRSVALLLFLYCFIQIIYDTLTSH